MLLLCKEMTREAMAPRLVLAYFQCYRKLLMHYVQLGSIFLLSQPVVLLMLAAPLLFFATGQITDGVAFALMTLVLWWKHRANLQRLMQGTESRIGAKA